MIGEVLGTQSAQGSQGTPGSEERKQVAILARQFEAMLLSQMLREMKDSMTPEQEEGGFGASILGDTANSEFGMALSKSGGLGLAE